MRHNIACKVSAAIVLYENDELELRRAIDSCLSSSKISRLFLIDNSMVGQHKKFSFDKRIVYIHNRKNMGFGAAHNIAIDAVSDHYDYHIIVNPDVAFDAIAIDEMILFMDAHREVGSLMPKILYPNGQLQKLCKLLPSPINLFARRFAILSKWTERMNKRYELQMFDYNTTIDIPNLSGCFMFIRTEVLKKVGGFDPRYFMYLEDIDLIRRIGEVSRTVFYPEAHVYHAYHKDSYKNRKLMLFHIMSAIKYFNKWGWFFDAKRKQKNSDTLKQIYMAYPDTEV